MAVVRQPAQMVVAASVALQREVMVALQTSIQLEPQVVVVVVATMVVVVVVRRQVRPTHPVVAAAAAPATQLADLAALPIVPGAALTLVIHQILCETELAKVAPAAREAKVARMVPTVQYLSRMVQVPRYQKM